MPITRSWFVLCRKYPTLPVMNIRQVHPVATLAERNEQRFAAVAERLRGDGVKCGVVVMDRQGEVVGVGATLAEALKIRTAAGGPCSLHELGDGAEGLNHALPERAHPH